MILLFTDYGLQGPYLGQVEAVFYRDARGERVINLVADLPRQNPKACAYLLAALVDEFPEDAIFFCVVDPGVGSFRDQPVILRVNHRWYVGPDNGLFDIVCRHAGQVECWKINWRPKRISDSFHGRDLYAPVVAMLAKGVDIPGEKITWKDQHGWPDEMAEVIYIDTFGNCMTGLRAGSISNNTELRINGLNIPYASTFSAIGQGKAFWYCNSIGLIEISVNQGNAAIELHLSVGSSLFNS